MRGGVATVVAMVLVAVGTTTLPAASSPKTEVVVATRAVEKVLESTFINYKFHSHAMVRSDHILWSRVRPSDPLAPLVAFDAVDHRFWALANFELVVPASDKAEVSFQDGGSYGIFVRTLHGRWVMRGYAGIPLCPSVVPTPVANVWHMVKYASC